jgi:hypothetical protein
MDLKFNFQDYELRHQCRSERQGDWFIFTCDECPGYERRFNYVTGELHTRPGSDPYILHQAAFAPVGLENFQASEN